MQKSYNTMLKMESDIQRADHVTVAALLMNNVVFGKTMENVRNRQNKRLATSWKKASQLINRPSFE